MRSTSGATLPAETRPPFPPLAPGISPRTFALSRALVKAGSALSSDSISRSDLTSGLVSQRLHPRKRARVLDVRRRGANLPSDGHPQPPGTAFDDVLFISRPQSARRLALSSRSLFHRQASVPERPTASGLVRTSSAVAPSTAAADRDPWRARDDRVGDGHGKRDILVLRFSRHHLPPLGTPSSPRLRPRGSGPRRSPRPAARGVLSTAPRPSAQARPARRGARRPRRVARSARRPRAAPP
jgi:hypothetical protein